MSELALVTGSTGWLGRRLVRALAEGLPDLGAARCAPGRPVRALLEPGGEAPTDFGESVTSFTGDVTVPESLRELFAGAAGATLFHCAGIIHPRKGVKQLYAVNTEGTRNVVAAARAAGIRRMVHVSSNSPFGCNPNPEHRFDESAPYNPYMSYGRSKMQGEKHVREAHGDGFETVVVRPPWFYGPDQPPRQSLFFSMIRQGRMPLVGSGRNVRSMSYVDNLCQGLLLAEQVPEAAGEVFWIADRRAYPMAEIIDTIATVMERDFELSVAKRRLKLPGITSDVARVVDSGLQSAGFYSEKIHVLSEMNQNIACSIDRACAVLGYDPHIDLEEGMRRSIDWVLAQGIEI